MKKFKSSCEAGEAGDRSAKSPGPLDETFKLGRNGAVAELGRYLTPSSLLILTDRCELPADTSSCGPLQFRGIKPGVGWDE